MQQSPASLKGALDDVRGLIAKVDGQTGPLLAALLERPGKRRSDSGPGDRHAGLGQIAWSGRALEVRFGLDNTLSEISGAARSIRVFADYLERHPEALLRGK